MIPTPPSFDSPFLCARAVRHGHHPRPVRPDRQLDASALIPWREFIQAIFELPPGWDYQGDIPEGVSPQQFWSRIYRASRQATRAQRLLTADKLNHAKIGIVTRGQRFWVWPIIVPKEEKKEDRVTNQKRGWIGELMLKLRSGEPIELGRKLSAKERSDLRARAARRGWRIHISRKAHEVQGDGAGAGGTRVQWIGEGKQ